MNDTKVIADVLPKGLIRMSSYTNLNNTANLYMDFLKSMDKVEEKTWLMCHKPSDVRFASLFFPGYLTDEELQERQYEGRFWDAIGSDLYILLDNETLLVVNRFDKDQKIFGREELPFSLQGRYYDEC